MNAVSADVWAQILEALSNSALCSLSACSKACRQVSSYKRTLKVVLKDNKKLHSRLVSLLHFLAGRREHLQVRYLQQHLLGSNSVTLAQQKVEGRVGQRVCQVALRTW